MAGQLRGRRVREYFAVMAGRWDDGLRESEEIVDIGDRVVARATQRRPGKAKRESGTRAVRRSGRSRREVITRMTSRDRRSPRSRGAVGVGDVAGERGDRAARSIDGVERAAASTHCARSPIELDPAVECRFALNRRRRVLAARKASAVRRPGRAGSDFEVEARGIIGRRRRPGRRVRHGAAGQESGAVAVEARSASSFKYGRAGRPRSRLPDRAKPSKPWGCRSRRCRRRTWRSCGGSANALIEAATSARIAAILDPEARVARRGPNWPERGRASRDAGGPCAVRRVRWDALGRHRVIVEELIAVGDRVVASIVRTRGGKRHPAVDHRVRPASDDCATAGSSAFEAYLGRAEALEAVGLSE